MTMRRQARGKGTLSARDAGSVPSDPYSTRPTHRLSVGRQELGGSHRGAIRGPPLFIARVRWIDQRTDWWRAMDRALRGGQSIARERWLDQWPADGEQWIDHSEGVSRLLATDGSINGRLMASNGSSTRR